MFTPRGEPLRACRSGSTVFANSSKCLGSRKKSVVLVVTTSTRFTSSSSMPRGLKRYSQYSSWVDILSSRRRFCSLASSRVFLVVGILMPSSALMNSLKRSKIFASMCAKPMPSAAHCGLDFAEEF